MVEGKIIIEPFKIPKPLEQLNQEELERKECIGRIMTYTLNFLTQRFLARDFQWLLPTIYSKVTDPLLPDPGTSLEKRVEIEIYGEKVKPTLSMIIHKMVASSLVYPKLFSLSPNLRIEKRERMATGIHSSEFTQLDFEVRGASSDYVRTFVEGLIHDLTASLKREMVGELKFLDRDLSLFIPTLPFKVYDREELEVKYGEGWATHLPTKIVDPIWVINIPREFYDFENLDGKWDNYDLILPRYGEVLSGSRRETDYSKLVRKMQRDGVKRENYKVLLQLAEEKRLRPSAGAGLGIERLVSWLTGVDHIGEVQPFPKIPGIVYDL